MRALYGLMGLVAQASGRMSRFSINGIPSNWLVIVVCGLVAGFAWESRQDAVSNGARPQPMSAGQFLRLADTRFAHRYVAVRGVILPRAALGVQSNHSTYDLVPMVDIATRRGFFIKASSGAFEGEPRQATVTGMMWGVQSDLRSDLRNAASRLAGKSPVTFNTDVQLSQGQAPGDPLLSTLLMGAMGVVSGIFLASSLLKHVIFERDKANKNSSKADLVAQNPFNSSTAGLPNAPADAPSTSPSTSAGDAGEGSVPVRVSGKMRLHEKCAGRFLDVPAVLARLENDELAVASNIDASSRMYGVVTQQRTGVWLLVPRAGSLRWEDGWLHKGARRAPALRLRFEDALDKNKPGVAVLSFNSEAEREAARREIAREAAP